VSWDAAQKECCSIGMQLAGMESDEEIQAIVAFKYAESIGRDIIWNLENSHLVCRAADNNLNIWVGAHQATDCQYRFKWCESGKLLLRNDSNWLEI
jgi:hypothetical protein